MNDELKRQAKWTQAIAVGERAFVEAIEEQIHSRQQMMITEQGGSWVLREEHGAMEALFLRKILLDRFFLLWSDQDSDIQTDF